MTPCDFFPGLSSHLPIYCLLSKLLWLLHFL
uniref:Uncharacterized protein n=1 Tax=Anguilla anguilla TaxID=7936 RepID=A0A0E9UB25_ANGAN